MSKFKRVFLYVLFIAVFVSGCSSGASTTDVGGNGTGGSSGESSPSPTSSSGTGGKIVVELWTLTGNNTTAAEALKKEFEAANPNIEIKITSNATDPHKEALKVAAASGSLPDIWYNWGGSLGSFYPENGFTLDLTEYAKENNWDQKFIKASLDLATLGGQLSGVPQHIRGLGFYYRKDIFDQYGLKEPQTFAEFEQILQTLKDNGITPFSTGGKGGWHPMRILELLFEHYAGPELHDKLNLLEESWDHPKVVEAYAKWKEWADKGYFMSGFLTLDPNEAKFELYQGKAAMQPEGPWFDTTILVDEQDMDLYGFFPMPTDQKPMRISSFIDMFQINSSSPKEVQEAALKFAEFAVEVSTAEKLGAVLNPPIPTIGAPIPEDTRFVPEVLEALDQGSFLITDQALPQEVIQKFFQAQEMIIFGEMTPEDAAKFMQSEIEKYKNK